MIDRRSFFCGLTGAALWAANAGATSAGTDHRPHEPTEVAWIMAALSPLGEKSGGTIRRDTPYFAEVTRWFASHRSHPSITALGGDFNLPRLVGNAADYRFNRAGKLVRAADATPLWDDADGDLFTRHRAGIEDFARQSAALRFLHSQAATFASSRAALFSIVNMEDMRSWLETEFSSHPAPIELFCSPLTGGWNWTNLGDRKPRIWVPEPKAQAATDRIERYIAIASVFTEIDHLYVNPVTKRHLAEVETTFGKDSGWANQQAWDDYPSAELIFNEYMTWSAFLEYAMERMSPSDYGLLQRRIVRFMQDGRGFVRFEVFAGMVHGIRTSQQALLEGSFARIIAEAGKGAR